MAGPQKVESENAVSIGIRIYNKKKPGLTPAGERPCKNRAEEAGWKASRISACGKAGCQDYEKQLKGGYHDDRRGCMPDGQIIRVPATYHHFEEGRNQEAYLVYLYPETNNFSADGIVYQGINKLDLELYTDIKDLEAEKSVEAVLKEHGFFYENKAYLESEKDV